MQYPGKSMVLGEPGVTGSVIYRRADLWQLTPSLSLSLPTWEITGSPILEPGPECVQGR